MLVTTKIKTLCRKKITINRVRSIPFPRLKKIKKLGVYSNFPFIQESV